MSTPNTFNKIIDEQFARSNQRGWWPIDINELNSDSIAIQLTLDEPSRFQVIAARLYVQSTIEGINFESTRIPINLDANRIIDLPDIPKPYTLKLLVNGSYESINVLLYEYVKPVVEIEEEEPPLPPPLLEDEWGMLTTAINSTPINVQFRQDYSPDNLQQSSLYSIFNQNISNTRNIEVQGNVFLTPSINNGGQKVGAVFVFIDDVIGNIFWFSSFNRIAIPFYVAQQVQNPKNWNIKVMVGLNNDGVVMNGFHVDENENLGSAGWSTSRLFVRH